MRQNLFNNILYNNIYMHFIITGYYKKNNLGDDLFEKYASILFKKFIKKYKNKISSYKILPIQDICEDKNIRNCDRVILFGGETLNDFFLDKLIELSQLKKDVKFNAIGVSCNQDYNSVINKLNIFESIIFRSKIDYINLSPLINSSYAPDMVFHLNKNISLTLRKNNIIGFFLSQTIMSNLNQNQKFKYIAHIINLIRYWLNQNYKIYMFSMCTNNIDSENDNIINETIFSQLYESEKTNVKVYTNNKKVLQKINQIKYAVCFRYHAHILCIINNIPFISISETPKVKTLLDENDINELYAQPVEFISKSKYILQNTQNIKNKLKNIYKVNKKKSLIYTNFDNYVFNKIENTFFINKKDYEFIYDYTCKKYKSLKNDDIYFNTQLLNFILMKSLNTPYSYGMQQKIHKGIEYLKNDIYWLINDNIIHKNIVFFDNISCILNKNNKKGLINITYIDQNEYKGLHRAGWQFVVDKLYDYNSASNENLLVDLYVDRTFHWNSYEYNKFGLIPYTKNWIGFIHHTCNTKYSNYNTIELFKNKLFIESLKYCKGLILLSNDLKSKVDELLKKNNINIDTYVIYHPTEFVLDDIMFTTKKFVLNTNKKIIQIGAWMRDIGAINRLELGNNPLYLNKFVLIGKKMENYYYDSDIDSKLQDNTENYSNLSESSNTSDLIGVERNSLDLLGSTSVNNIMCRDVNKQKTILNKDVSQIYFLENNEFDNLLSDNIVFIKLEDASAVNTVIECIVRNTPIIVNRLPALEEILGKKYPLFYNSINDVKNLLTMKYIEKGYEYLKNLNKTELKLETFINKFTNIVNQIYDNNIIIGSDV